MIPLRDLADADLLALRVADGDFSFIVPSNRAVRQSEKFRQFTYLKGAYRFTYAWLYDPRPL